MLNQVVEKINALLPIYKDYTASLKSWDWKVIGICFFTSFTFWLFNALNDQHTYDLQIPLKFDFNRKQVVILKAPPENITVNVTGNGWNLFKNSVDPDFSAEIVTFENVNTAVSTNFYATRSLLPRIASKIKELDVNFILQDSITFDFDTLSTKTVKVNIDKESISLKNDFKITTSILMEPNEIVIEGASSLLAQMDDTIALAIDEEEIDSDFSDEVSLEFLATEFINPTVKGVNVTFSVAEFERRKMNVGLVLVNFPRNSNITVEPGTAIFSYLIEKNEQYMPRDSLKLVLDYNKLSKKDSTIQPNVKVPPYFMEYAWTPEKFKVSIEK